MARKMVSRKKSKRRIKRYSKRRATVYAYRIGLHGNLMRVSGDHIGAYSTAAKLAQARSVRSTKIVYVLNTRTGRILRKYKNGCRVDTPGTSTIKCLNCGAAVSVKSGRGRRPKYCSQKCGYDYRSQRYL